MRASHSGSVSGSSVRKSDYQGQNTGGRPRQESDDDGSLFPDDESVRESEAPAAGGGGERKKSEDDNMFGGDDDDDDEGLFGGGGHEDPYGLFGSRESRHTFSKAATQSSAVDSLFGGASEEKAPAPSSSGKAPPKADMSFLFGDNDDDDNLFGPAPTPPVPAPVAPPVAAPTPVAAAPIAKKSPGLFDDDDDDDGEHPNRCTAPPHLLPLPMSVLPSATCHAAALFHFLCFFLGLPSTHCTRRFLTVCPSVPSLRRTLRVWS